jgi:exportin-7
MRLQVPATWRDRIQSGATLRLLFNVYKGCTTGRIPIIPDAPAPAVTAVSATDAAAAARRRASGVNDKPAAASMVREFAVSAARASQTLDALCLMVSVRRSLFAAEADRKWFLTHIIRGVVEVLREQQGLSHEDCFHGFARLLSRVRSNYQLNDLIKVEGYTEWLDLVAQFTIAACGKPTWCANSMHYILGLWARLVSAIPYVRLENSTGGSGATGATDVTGRTPAASPLSPDALIESYIPKVSVATRAALSVAPRARSSVLDAAPDAYRVQIVSAYVRGRVEALVGPHAEDAMAELDDIETLEDQLDHLPTICRFHYEPVAAGIASILDPLVQRYGEGVTYLRSHQGGSSAETAFAAMRVVECQLSWIINVVGAIIGGAAQASSPYFASYGYIGGSASSSGTPSALTDEACDADLARRVLTLMSQIDTRLSSAMLVHQQSGMAAASTAAALRMFRSDARLELSFVYFMSNFRKAYVTEQAGMPTVTEAAASAAAANGLGGSSTTAALLLAPSAPPTGSAVTPGTPSMQELLESATGRRKTFLAMLVRMGLGDHLAVVTSMIQKLANNLRYWGERQDVVKRTLEVLHDLVYSYSSGKLLLTLDCVSGMLLNHTADYFPFLAVPANTHLRTMFYTTLARLVFMEDESEVSSSITLKVTDTFILVRVNV